MKLQSTYAMLDVMRGRVGLKKAIERGKAVSVVIEGEISDMFGNDDGVSREFNVDVKRVTVKEPTQ